LVDCASIASATKATAASITGLSSPDLVQLDGIVNTWCAYLGATEGGWRGKTKFACPRCSLRSGTAAGRRTEP
jgi:hypothetical protein